MSPDSRQRFAQFLEDGRTDLLDVFIGALQESGSVLAEDPEVLQQVRTSAGVMMDDAVASVRAGDLCLDPDYRLLASKIGAARAAGGIHPQESTRAASLWFHTLISKTVSYLAAHPDAFELFALFTLGLERSMTMRIRESMGAYTGYLLEELREAQVKERRRIARELHDEIGHGLSVTHRQLELYEARRSVDQTRAAINLDTAMQSVLRTMQKLRAVTSELHLKEPAKSLEKALLVFLENIEDSDEVAVDLRVYGDEAWAPPAVRDETFVIIREAIRNALAHSGCTEILVRVNIAPRELRSVVEDNGRGFLVDGNGPSRGVGLASMRERAELLGGKTIVTSRPDLGTMVELFVPYGENGDAR